MSISHVFLNNFRLLIVQGVVLQASAIITYYQFAKKRKFEFSHQVEIEKLIFEFSGILIVFFVFFFFVNQGLCFWETIVLEKKIN